MLLNKIECLAVEKMARSGLIRKTAFFFLYILFYFFFLLMLDSSVSGAPARSNLVTCKIAMVSGLTARESPDIPTLKVTSLLMLCTDAPSDQE